MDCAWQTLRTFSQNHRHLRGSPGAIAVLHTHARDLHFHPFIRMSTWSSQAPRWTQTSACGVTQSL